MIVESTSLTSFKGRPVRVPGQNLTYSIVQHLGAAIVSGKYSEKRPFPVEADLCRQYAASRSVLREAVKMLTAKGLLGARPRQGTWVQPEDEWNLLDPDVLGWLLERKFCPALLVQFTQIRLAVEPEAAALAAQGGPAARAAVRAGIERMLAAERGDEDPLEAQIAFHVAILRASGNRFYAQLRELIQTALRFSIRATNTYKGVHLTSLMDHHKIVADAILAGDPRRAADAMRALIQEVLDLIQSGKPPAAAKATPRATAAKATPRAPARRRR